MAFLNIPDRTGHTAVAFAPEAFAEAKTCFDAEKKKGMAFFATWTVEARGPSDTAATKPTVADKAVLLTEFDPTADAITGIRPMVGG